MERFTALLLLLHKLVNTEHLPSLCCSLLIVSDCILLMEEMMESLYNPAICVPGGMEELCPGYTGGGASKQLADSQSNNNKCRESHTDTDTTEGFTLQLIQKLRLSPS